MDTSETYIKMCDCPEIQKGRAIDGLRQWQTDDLLFKEAGRGNQWRQDAVVTLYNALSNPPQFRTRSIWLPRQDQLQAMVESTCSVDLLTRFQRWVAFDEEDSPDDSMEQLWLAFVMKEKHNKIWNGEEWNEITN